MPLLDHLEELRRRVIVVAIAIAIAGDRRLLPGRPHHRAPARATPRRRRRPDPADGGRSLRSSPADRPHERRRAGHADHPLRGLGLRDPRPDPSRAPPGMAAPRRGDRALRGGRGARVTSFCRWRSGSSSTSPCPGCRRPWRSGSTSSFTTTFLLAFGIALEFPVIMYLLARAGHPLVRLPFAASSPGDRPHRALRDRHHPRRHRDRLGHARRRHVRPLRAHPPADPPAGALGSAVSGSVWLLTDAAMDRHAVPGHPSEPSVVTPRRPGSAMRPALG